MEDALAQLALRIPPDQRNHSSGVSPDRRLANAIENTIAYRNTGADHGNRFAPASSVF